MTDVEKVDGTLAERPENAAGEAGTRKIRKRGNRDAEATRAAILQAATAEFAREGYGGARVDKISQRAGANERMLYYYFGSKEELFRAVLESVYDELISAERALDLHALHPVDGVRRFIAFTWTYYLDHPEFISLVNTENLYKAEHVRRSQRVQSLSLPQVDILRDLLGRGQASGCFRADVEPVEMLLTITSQAYFYQSNTHTFSHYLGQELAAPAAQERWLKHITRVVLEFLTIDASEE